MISLPYTICFCLHGEQVLMLYRRKAPNADHWNGLGGKIEPGETPLMNIQREMIEEAAIDLHQAQELRFAGLVTWTFADNPTRNGGMYAFLARLTSEFPTWPDRACPEGLLSWKPLAWVCDPDNLAVVSNIPRFLPGMLESSGQQEYRCSYHDDRLQSVVAHPMMPDNLAGNMTQSKVLDRMFAASISLPGGGEEPEASSRLYIRGLREASSCLVER